MEAFWDYFMKRWGTIEEFEKWNRGNEVDPEIQRLLEQALPNSRAWSWLKEFIGNKVEERYPPLLSVLVNLSYGLHPRPGSSPLSHQPDPIEYRYSDITLYTDPESFERRLRQPITASAVTQFWTAIGDSRLDSPSQSGQYLAEAVRQQFWDEYGEVADDSEQGYHLGPQYDISQGAAFIFLRDTQVAIQAFPPGWEEIIDRVCDDLPKTELPRDERLDRMFALDNGELEKELREMVFDYGYRHLEGYLYDVWQEPETYRKERSGPHRKMLDLVEHIGARRISLELRWLIRRLEK